MAFIKFFRFCNFTGSIFSFINSPACHGQRVHTKVLYKMKTAYFYNIEGEEKVDVALQFTEHDVTKLLIFERNITEPIRFFLNRLHSKLETVCTKKLKKKRNLDKEVIDKIDFNPLMLINNEQISGDLLFQDIFKKDFNGNLILRILDSDYEVILNSPVINEMSLPKILQVGCTIAPAAFETKFTDIKKSDFVWYKSLKPLSVLSWEKCGEGYFYKIQEKDLNHSLKLSCTPKTDKKIGPTVETVSKTPVVSDDNLTEILARHEYTKEKTNADEFRIVTYNILADLYVNTKEAKTQIFTFCDPSHLDVDYRKNLLDYEIMGYNADILCFQEFERKFYNANLFLFNEMGYECLYSEKEGTREGSGFLYDKRKFHIVKANQHTFTRELVTNPMFSDIYLKIKDNSELMSRLENISSQLQVVVLECVMDNVLVIGNVHLYFHPDACHIRLLQGILALKILLKTAQDIKEMGQNKKVSILLCGDFNSTPECGFHKLLQEGSVDSNQTDWRSKESEAITDISFSHSLNFKSSYDNTRYTNFIPSFKGCLDYIYYQPDQLQLKQTVPIPSEEVLSRYKGIPSKFFPSDHVALIADFKFNSDK